MFNSSNGVPSIADIAAVTDNNNDGMWGNGSWWVILLIILCFGWGGYGNGFGGNNNAAIPYVMSTNTDSEVSRGFDNLAVNSKLDTISSDICSGLANTNMGVQTGFMNLNTQLCSSFDSVTAGINNLGYNLQNDLLQISNLVDGVKYENAANTAQIIQAGNDNTQRLMDMLTQNQIQDLRDRLQNAEFENSQSAQTASIISQLQPVARPSYIVSSPYASQMFGTTCPCMA